MRSQPLDALRFASFLMVFAVHALPVDPVAYPYLGQIVAHLVSTGRWGVDVFFVLSAYLITKGLLAERERTGRIDVRAFYVRRFARIAPLLVVFLAIAAPIAGLDWRYTVGFLAMVGNWTFVALGDPSRAFAPLWSLAVEEQFYAIWPRVVARCVSPVQCAFIMLAVAYLSRAVLTGLNVEPEHVWVMTFTRLDPLAIGVLLAAVPLPSARPATTVALGAGALIAANALLAGYWTLAYPVGSIGAGAIVIGALNARYAPQWAARLGQASYGLYILHSAVVAASVHYFAGGTHLGNSARVAGALAITIAAAMAAHWLETAVRRHVIAATQGRGSSGEARSESPGALPDQRRAPARPERSTG